MDGFDFLFVDGELVDVPLHGVHQHSSAALVLGGFAAEGFARAGGLLQALVGFRLHAFEVREHPLDVRDAFPALVELLELHFHLPDHLVHAP